MQQADLPMKKVFLPSNMICRINPSPCREVQMKPCLGIVYGWLQPTAEGDVRLVDVELNCRLKA
jgi:hypothetical protein